MSIQNLYPNISPTLSLDFANVQQLDPRISFARASTATYYGTQTAKAEENLLVQSQAFETTWTTQGITTTANTSTAPDGTTTADTITETTTNSAHRTEQTVATSGTVTLSVFAKLGSGTRFLTIGVSRDTTHASSATFDLSLGTNTQTQVNGGIYASPSATITAVAQGFYRCTFTVTTDTATLVRIGLNDTGTPSSGNRGFGAGYTGDDTSSLILWGAQLEARSAVTAYTATTTQPITNYIPVLETAASGVARFDHNPTTFESLGLLIEESRTNLLTYSEQFNNAAWTKSNSTITANTIIAPDGALTGDLLIENTTTGVHALDQFATLVAGVTYALSVFAKASTRTRVRVAGRTFASWSSFPDATFDLSAGTVTSVSGAATPIITPVGNGWFRCTVFGTASATSAGININLILTGTTSNYTGDGFSGLFLWGAQLEAGAFATSYIQTVASQVTRASDAASMTGTNFSSWYNAAEGTFYGEGIALNVSSSGRISSANDGSQNNEITVAIGATTQFTVREASTNRVLIAGGTAVNNVAQKIAGSYAVGNYGVSLNGATVTTNTYAGSLPVVNQLSIGNRGATGAAPAPLNGTIRKLSYYPIRCTNAQLQALTS
jgi:hypothetical protein